MTLAAVTSAAITQAAVTLAAVTLAAVTLAAVILAAVTLDVHCHVQQALYVVAKTYNHLLLMQLASRCL